MGYESQMQADVLAILELFRGRVPDPETHEWTLKFTADRESWGCGHDLFGRVRDRNLKAMESGDGVRECQYCFEEACIKSFYNETDTDAPFDACSPYWIIKNALALARAIGIPVQEVVAIAAPDA